MTSPVDTSVKYFSSNMPNAPVLSGTAGALIALLDACLKDGFNSITPTSIVVAGGIATLSWASGTFAALPDSVVLIAGVTDKTGLNGEQKVLTKSALSITFATAETAGTATLSAATVKIAPLGWLKPQSGTNLAAYQSSDSLSTKMLLRVDDTGTTMARVVGYESMTDVNTGVNPFPSAAQMSGGGYWSKSVNASAATVNWSLHGDGRIFYLNVQPGSSNALVNQICSGKVFGDVIPTKPGGDPYACCLNYAQTATIGNQTDGAFGASGDFKFAMPRDFTGLGSSVMYGAWTLTGNGGVSGLANALGSFPSPIDGGLWLCKKFLYTSILSSPRAIFPGLLNVVQSGVWNSFKQGDSVPGSGIYAGKNLMAATTSDNSTAFTTASTAANTGIIFFDVTGPWR